MEKLLLDNTECGMLQKMIAKAELENSDQTYTYDPGFATYSCSCTAHKKSCGWD